MSIQELANEVLEGCLTEKERQSWRIALGLSLCATAEGYDLGDPETVFERMLEATKTKAPERSYYRYQLRKVLPGQVAQLIADEAA